MGQFFSANCKSSVRLDGKTAIITGANAGIGKCTAQDLYLRGARVIIACRSLDKAQVAISEIKKCCEGKTNLGTLSMIELDLSSFESVRKCADEILMEEELVNILVNNAGVFGLPEQRTKDGIETQIATNHFGHFLFTMLLLPKIIKSAPARIVNVSSMAHRIITELNIDDINWEHRTYDRKISYAESKLANLLFSKELARRLEEAKISGVTTYSLHPGIIITELFKNFATRSFPGVQWFIYNILPYFLKTPEQGAQTTIYCAVDRSAGKETGQYYSNCKVVEPSANTKNDEVAKQLWEISCKVVGLEDYNPFLE